VNCHGEDAQGIEGIAPAIKGTDITFQEFFTQVRLGKGEMPAFSTGEIPDGYLRHIWTWLTTE
jgi:mono/diheme cytochrome c family protein